MSSGSTTARYRSTNGGTGRGRASARMFRRVIFRSDAAGLHVTEHVTGAAQENDAVTGGVRSIPFEFVVRDFDFGSVLEVRPAERFVGPIIGGILGAVAYQAVFTNFALKAAGS